jgi:hypothetical protein
MGMVGGLDVHRAQITFDWVDHDTGEVGRGRVAPATREMFRSWLEQLPTRGARSRWRPPPGGGSWPKNSPGPGSSRTWPSRPTPPQRAAASGGRRPTGRMRSIFGCCSSRIGCPSRGSRRPTCSISARRPGCVTPWSSSVASGSSASTRSCITTGCQAGQQADHGQRPARGWPRSTCRRRRGTRSRSRPASSTSCRPHSIRSTGGCGPTPAASPAVRR